MNATASRAPIADTAPGPTAAAPHAAREARPDDRWMAIGYNVLLALCLPIALAYLLWHVFCSGRIRQGFRERLGLLPEGLRKKLEGDDAVIWVQAVSSGEVTAALPVIRELRLREPLAKIVLSTTTPTGREMAEKHARGEVDAVFYFPLDFPFVVNRVLAIVRPALLVLVETELWPNLLSAAQRRGTRVVAVNAKISDRALRRSRIVRPVYRWMMRNVDQLCAQSGEDAERLKELGADPAIVGVLGNTKFDGEYVEVSAAQAARMRQELGVPTAGPVVVAGSTNPREEEVVLDSFAKIRMRHADARLIIAPRHPERAEEIESLVRDRGWHAARRTRMLAGDPDADPSSQAEDTVVILDTMGELAALYAVGTVVFVGGSLIPKGGHNILQPLAQGKPVLFGPHMHNQRDTAALALAEKVAWQVENADEMADEMLRLIESPTELARVDRKARDIIAQNRGAARRCAAVLGDALSPQTQNEPGTAEASGTTHATADTALNA